MDVKQRARELVEMAASAGHYGIDYHEERMIRESDVLAVIIAALTPPEGHVIVTRNEAGQAVAVTRQDGDGRILSVIAEFEAPDGYVLVPVEPTEAMIEASYGHYGPGAYEAMLAARPEVP